MRIVRPAKLATLVPLLAAIAGISLLHAQDDVVMKAMRDEMARVVAAAL